MPQRSLKLSSFIFILFSLFSALRWWFHLLYLLALWTIILPHLVYWFHIVYFSFKLLYSLALLLLSHFSCVRLCATPYTAAHQAPPSLGFSRQEHWSGLPFPSSMHESEKWKWNHSVVSNSSQPHGLPPTRLLHPWDFPGKSTGVGCHCLLQFFSSSWFFL